MGQEYGKGLAGWLASEPGQVGYLRLRGLESMRVPSLTWLGLGLGLRLAAGQCIQTVLELSWGCHLQYLPMASAFGLGISHQ